MPYGLQSTNMAMKVLGEEYWRIILHTLGRDGICNEEIVKKLTICTAEARVGPGQSQESTLTPVSPRHVWD